MLGDPIRVSYWSFWSSCTTTYTYIYRLHCMRVSCHNSVAHELNSLMFFQFCTTLAGFRYLLPIHLCWFLLPFLGVSWCSCRMSRRKPLCIFSNLRNKWYHGVFPECSFALLPERYTEKKKRFHPAAPTATLLWYPSSNPDRTRRQGVTFFL